MYIFESKNIAYREMTLDDTDNVLMWRNNDDVAKNFFYKESITRETHVAYYENFIKTGKSIQFVMKDKKTGIEFGCVYFSHVNRELKTGEIGIFIANSSFRGKGYGTEALRALGEFGFDELKFSRVDARVKRDNICSIKSLLKIGYKENMELLESSDFDGNIDDVVFMSLNVEVDK